MRPINKIAADILRDWGPPPHQRAFQIYARPYVDAMLELTQISDHYGLDDAEDILLRCLDNLASWRGAFARGIKSEINQHLKEKHDTDDNHGS